MSIGPEAMPPSEAIVHTSRWIAAVWSVAVLAGVFGATRLESRPGAVREAPPHWPNSSRVPRSGQHSLVVTFVRPDCPCSRATLGELLRIQKDQGSRVETVIVVSGSGKLGSPTSELPWGWDPGNAVVLFDKEGNEATRFGAATSGLTVVYSPSGKLLYAGGVTPARGHEGPNRGALAVLNAIATSRPVRGARVFGCALQTTLTQEVP